MTQRALAFMVVVATALAAGCGATGEPATGSGSTNGTLIFASAEGKVVVSDPTTGAHREFESSLGRPMSFSLSLDGRQAAFGVSQADDVDPHVVVMDLATGAMREIRPEAHQRAEFWWGAGGFFLHRTYTLEPQAYGGTNIFFVVTDGATVGRPLAAGAPIDWFRTSAYAPLVVYSNCVDGGDQPCVKKLVVESATGDSSKVLASGADYAPIGFTPDGASFLVVALDVGTTSGAHLFRYDLATGVSADLGVAGPVFTGLGGQRSDTITGGQLLSPDGQEALVRRGADTFAVKVDGSGERVVTTDASTYRSPGAAFTGAGAVVYEADTVTSTGFDSESATSSLWVIQAGVPRQMTPTKSGSLGPPCGIPLLSRSGHTAAWYCQDGLYFISVDDASIVRSLPDPAAVPPYLEIVDADAHDRGFVAAIDFDGGNNQPFLDRELVFLGSNGERRSLGKSRVFTPADGFQRGASFAYLP